jgi:hypothetical protein
MRTPARLALALALAAGCRKEPAPVASEPEAPVGWSVTAKADKTELQVGEPVTLSVRVRHPAGAEFLLPTGASLAPFELLGRVDEPPSSPTETRITLRLAAYRLPGDIQIPPLKVEYQGASGQLTSVGTDAIPMKLVTSLTPDVTDIHDLKGPIEDIPVPSRWGRLWWLLLALLAALAGYLLYRKLRRKTEPVGAPSGPPPLLPPDAEAVEALRRLGTARFLEKGQVLEFYTALSEILKRYAGRRFEVPYLERTTVEVLADLRRVKLPDEWWAEMRRLLEASDLVKFARLFPGQEESRRMLPDAFRFVEETRAKPAPQPAPLAPVAEARA